MDGAFMGMFGEGTSSVGAGRLTMLVFTAGAFMLVFGIVSTL
jgi:hypothetical protein